MSSISYDLIFKEGDPLIFDTHTDILYNIVAKRLKGKALLDKIVELYVFIYPQKDYKKNCESRSFYIFVDKNLTTSITLYSPCSSKN